MVIHVDLSFRPLEEITAVNSPYRLPPVVQQIIGAPVRLFSLSDLALGPYGTALWIDTHTENLTVDQVDRGQRLASKFTPLSDVHEELDEGVDVADQTSITGPSSINLYNDGDDWSKVGLDEEEGMIAIGHTDGRITVLDFV